MHQILLAHHHKMKVFCLPVFLLLMILTQVAASLAPIAPVKKVVVVGGTHGNEYTGVWVIKSLSKRMDHFKEKYPSLTLSTLLANPEAHMANKRFVDADLNRQFSHEALHGMDDDGLPRTVESLRAREINELLGPKFVEGEADMTTDVIIDLHSTTTNMGITLIVAERDALMTRAAAYALEKCGPGTQCLLHTHESREARPNLSSTSRHGFTIEVGPVPQGVLRHDAVEKTEKALGAVLEFLERHNKEQEKLFQELVQYYSDYLVPCFRSAPAQREGEMSGKITWPCDPQNENFPAWMIHKDLQDQDFKLIETGDVLFIDLEGNEVTYNGSHGSPVHLIFINEGGYYYKSSGTGVGVAIQSQFDLDTGKLITATEQCASSESDSFE
jgi:succinylglutamate desuccinylase